MSARRTQLILLASLGVLLTCNYFLRHCLEQADGPLPNYFASYYTDTLDELYSGPIYRLLLPLPEWTGSWTTTSLVLLPPLTGWLGSYGRVYEFLNLVFVVTCFVTSWITFRSTVFTLTLTICAAFTTYNYHVYAVSGSVNQYFIVSYLMVLLTATYRIFESAKLSRGWLICWGVSLALFVLSYEGWLDSVVFLWLAWPLPAVILYRAGDMARYNRLLRMIAVVTVTAVFYIATKIRFGYGQTSGKESDVVFNYSSVVVAAEDIVSNVITMFYSVMTIYVPPYFVGSNSLWQYGGQELMVNQGGYHRAMGHLVPMNHLFLWRFYAGMAMTIFLYALYKTGKKAFLTSRPEPLILYCLLLMVLVGSPTHALVKWRPMHAVPHLTYHFYFGAMGVTLLVAYGTKIIHDVLKHRRTAGVIVGCVWLNILLCAFLRPPFLNHLSNQVGMGTYPDPWSILVAMFF